MRKNAEKNFHTEDISESNKALKELVSFLRDLVIIFLIVILIRVFLVTPFRINGSSMETSYHDKEYIIVDKASYLNLPVTYKEPRPTAHSGERALYAIMRRLPIHIGDPKRGDVVVVTPHVDRQKEYYIKRIIGLPGDMIRFEDGEVFIKPAGGSDYIQLKESYLSAANAGQTRLPENVRSDEYTIPEGYFWVM
jgi:signal peptidase I